MSAKYRPGDLLIYKKQKRSTQPGPRAHSIAAAVQDGQFRYVVDKYWIVQEVFDDGTIEARTRQGKLHRLKAEDPNLHLANWWQLLWYRNRFVPLAQALADEA